MLVEQNIWPFFVRVLGIEKPGLDSFLGCEIVDQTQNH